MSELQIFTNRFTLTKDEMDVLISKFYSIFVSWFYTHFCSGCKVIIKIRLKK